MANTLQQLCDDMHRDAQRQWGKPMADLMRHCDEYRMVEGNGVPPGASYRDILRMMEAGDGA